MKLKKKNWKKKSGNIEALEKFVCIKTNTTFIIIIIKNWIV